jgi:hypothetical protein
MHDAPRCPNCARPRPMLMLDLQSSAASTRPRPHVIERAGRRHTGVIAVVAVAIVVSVIVGVARLTADGASDASTAPETSEPATTTPTTASTTLAPATTAPVTTKLVPSSVTTEPPRSASPTYINGRSGAVFGEKVAFRLYAFDATTLRGYVETTTGQLVYAASSVPGDHVFPGSDTRLFVLNTRTKSLSSIDRNLRESPVLIARDVVWAFPSSAGKLWALVERSDSTNVSHVVEFTVEGTTVAELNIQAPFAVRGSLGGSVVTSAAGQIFLHDPKTGRMKQYAVGELTAINGARAAWLGCDATPSCHTYIGDATRPQLATLPVSASQPDSGWVLSLSPTGDAAVLPPSARPGYRLLNFATGLDLPLTAGDDELVWSPDGKWLFNANSSPPQAIDVPAGRTVDISLAGPDRAPFRVVPL